MVKEIGSAQGMSRLSRRAFVGGVGAVLLAGCSTVGRTGAASVGAATKGKLAQEDGLYVLRATTPVGSTGYNEFQIADELGFFRDSGIKVKYVGAKPTNATEFQLIQQGTYDVAYSGHPPQVAQARLAGVEVTSVVPGMVDHEKYPHVNYLVKKDSPRSSLRDIEGAKIGISGTGPCTDGYLKYYAQHNGLDATSLNFITMPTGGQPEQAVLEGLIDVTDSHPPYAGFALETGEYRSIGTTWDIFHNAGAGLSVRSLPDWVIRDYPEVAQGFVDAMYRARLWSNDHMDEGIKLTSVVLGVDQGKSLAFFDDPNKNITPSYIDIWFDIAEQIGLWKKGDILPDDIYTNEFVPKDPPESDKDLHWSGKLQNPIR